jgi:zinc transporter ZupT
MDYLTGRYLAWAMALGGISALSLPLGSAFGLMTRPSPRCISILQAFGAGALITALAVELVAPTALALGHAHAAHAATAREAFYALIGGAVIGGTLYFLLDQLVNAHGGFLRRTATCIQYFRLNTKKRQMLLVDELSRIPLLRCLSPEHINALVNVVHPVAWLDGDIILREGDRAERLTFILDGNVEGVGREGTIVELGPGSVLGLALAVMGIPMKGQAVAKGNVKGFAVAKDDFDRLRALAPPFDHACRDEAGRIVEHIRDRVARKSKESTLWLARAASALRTTAEVPDATDLLRAREEHKGASLAIWLGILLDGIPESFVIGAGLLLVLRAATDLPSITFGQVVPYTLIAALFLSNFPEALASSANMRLQGWNKQRIFWLWLSLMVITAVGAGVGYFVIELLSPTFVVFAQGVAAGAMLTMIAAAMIPEAVHLGSANTTGLSTLAGFLTATCFKLLE